MISEKKQIFLDVLLADDDIDDRSFFEKALKEISILTHLVTVNNGEELMNYLANNLEFLPDVVFLDLSMPRKTGYECLIEIKEDEKLKNIPVVMFSTSFTHGIDLEQSLMSTLSNIGAQDYIRKPSDFEQLKQVIKQALLKIIEQGELKNKDKKVD